MEYAGTFGFPTWTDSLRPCFCCNSTTWLLYSIEQFGRNSLPWTSNSKGDYAIACDRAEVHIVVDKLTCALLEDNLYYDKRDHGNRGRCLTNDIVSLGLCKGDRLEPSKALPDVGGLHRLKVFPVPLVFWRCCRESIARHRNPMLEHPDADPVDCLTVDTLHALFLGAIKVLNCHVVWFLLLSGIFGVLGTADEQLDSAVRVLRMHLNMWFQRRHAENPHERLTRPSDFTKGMIGDVSARVLKLKGAENWSFLLFLNFMLKQAEDQLALEAARLIKATDAMIKLITIFRTSPCRLSDDAIDECWALYGFFLELTNHYEDLLIPKRHIIAHMLEKLPEFGNPELYGNWFDEHLNKLLKNACRSVSQQGFETSILHSMNYLLKRVRAVES